MHDAHHRMNPAKFRAIMPSEGAIGAYRAELPPVPPHEVLVEMLNAETRKRRVVACRTEEGALRFARLFNLVSSLCRFDEAVTEHQHRLEQMQSAHYQEQMLPDAADLFTKENQRRIELWVQNFVIKHEDGKGEMMAFQNEPIS